MTATGPSAPFSEREQITAKRSEKRQRTLLVGVRMKQDEYDRLLAFATTYDMTLPGLLRLAANHLQITTELREIQ